MLRRMSKLAQRWRLGLAAAAVLAGGLCHAESMLRNGDFSGEWAVLSSNWETGTAEGEIPEGWEDVSTWSGADTRYSRIPGPEGEGQALRLEMLAARQGNSTLNLRYGSDLTIEAGRAYVVSGWFRSPTETLVEVAIRQHQPPRINFFTALVTTDDEWQYVELVAAPRESGPSRFFVSFREPGTVDVANLSIRLLPEGQEPETAEPLPVAEVRCVPSRGELIRHSDIVAMYSESDPEVLRRYRIDVVAWGNQLQATEQAIADRRRLLERAHAAGVRFHAVDSALVQEGGRFVVAEGNRESPHAGLFWELRRDHEGTLRRLAEAGIDLTRETVLGIDGDWIGVPWLRNRFGRIPMASVYSPAARQWFLEHMDAIAATGPTALHFDEPNMGSYGLLNPDVGDFSDHAMRAFREWLGKRPAAVWQEAGIETLDGFDYREMVRAHGGPGRRVPLWREFVRFQLFTTVEQVRELRDRVRQGVGSPIPLSMNANAATWIKLPLLELQDFMTTEVSHEARTRQPPVDPLLIYKLGDAIGQPVATTAYGMDWYEMKTDEHPALVNSWLALGYGLGHHLMIPARAWVMDPVTGSDTYRPTHDHYVCMARFIKDVAHLLDGYEALSTVAVAVGCDAIERSRTNLRQLVFALADANIPFHMAIEGNDLLDRQIGAEHLAGATVIVQAVPALLSAAARNRIAAAAGERPVVDHFGGPLPGILPRPIQVEGAEGVWVLPRAIPGNAEAPVAVHLLNRDYAPEARRMVRKGPFTLRLDERLFSGREFAAASLHQPILTAELPADGVTRETVELPVVRRDGQVEIRIPSLDTWGVIELR